MFGFRKYYKIQSKDGKVKYRILICNNEGIRLMKFIENKKNTKSSKAINSH